MLLPYIGIALIVLGLTKDQDETIYDQYSKIIAIVSGILFWTVFLIRVNM